MAQKRMFDKAIIDTDKFMDLPVSGKALYFLLGMEADDEGFVSTKKVLRIHGGTDDDVKVLIVKNFIIPFESGVVVITDWNQNNWLDSRRIKPTQYRNEKKLLSLTEDKSYVLSTCLAHAKPEESRGEEKRVEEKKKYGEFQKVHLSEGDLNKLREKYGVGATNSLIDELDSYLEMSGKKYKSHYATLCNWARRKKIELVRPALVMEETTLTEEQIEKNKIRIAAMRKSLAETFVVKNHEPNFSTRV